MNDKNQPIVKNVLRCGICGAAADRYNYGFQCQANSSHLADLNVGIWSNLTYPVKSETISEFCDAPAGSFGEFMLDQKEKLAEYNNSMLTLSTFLFTMYS